MVKSHVKSNYIYGKVLSLKEFKDAELLCYLLGGGKCVAI